MLCAKPTQAMLQVPCVFSFLNLRSKETSFRASDARGPKQSWRHVIINVCCHMLTFLFGHHHPKVSLSFLSSHSQVATSGQGWGELPVHLGPPCADWANGASNKFPRKGPDRSGNTAKPTGFYCLSWRCGGVGTMVDGNYVQTLFPSYCKMKQI